MGEGLIPAVEGFRAAGEVSLSERGGFVILRPPLAPSLRPLLLAVVARGGFGELPLLNSPLSPPIQFLHCDLLLPKNLVGTAGTHFAFFDN